MGLFEGRDQRRSRRVLRGLDRAARRRGRTGRTRGSTALLALAVVVGGTAWLLDARDLDLTRLDEVFRPRAYVEIDGRPVAVPRPGRPTGRVEAPVAVTTTGSHAFLHVDDDGEPVGYDPCRTVRFVVRPDHAPPSGDRLLADAMDVVGSAAGLRFEDVGTTDEPPHADRPIIQPDRYGTDWAPVLVAWADEEEVPELAGQVAGVGGSAAVPGADGQGQWLAAGRVVLDAPDLTTLLARSEGYVQARAIVVHELAHVLGLDHVDDPGELMHPLTSARTDLGPGDRQGLALVGQVACQA